MRNKKIIFEKLMSIKITKDIDCFGDGYKTTIKMSKLNENEFNYMINKLTEFYNKDK